MACDEMQVGEVEAEHNAGEIAGGVVNNIELPIDLVRKARLEEMGRTKGKQSEAWRRGGRLSVRSGSTPTRSTAQAHRW